MMLDPSEAATLQIIPTRGGAGAEVIGMDLSRPPAPGVVERLKMVLADRGVLLFRNQDLSESDQVRFIRAFGETMGHPLPGVGGASPKDSRESDVFYLTHGVEDSEDYGQKSGDGEYKKKLGEGKLGWHTDLQYMPEPQVYSLLYAIEIPPEGGDTEYCNLGAAYEALDEETKQRIAGLGCVHWYSRKIPPVTHPVVRVHPLNGRKILYVSPGLSRKIDAMDEKESKALLQKLFDHCTQKRFCWTHSWSVGDALIWDNRCTMHQRHGFDTTQRRVVRRTQTKGEPVIAAS